jgi:hypothetical protein
MLDVQKKKSMGADTVLKESMCRHTTEELFLAGKIEQKKTAHSLMTLTRMGRKKEIIQVQN